MYGLSRRIFFVFLWMTASSLSAMVFYAAASLVLPDSGSSLLWMNIAIYVIGAVGALIYSLKKMPSALKFLLLLLLVFACSFGAKFFVEAFFLPAKTAVLDYPFFGAFVAVVFLFLFFPLSFLAKRFRAMFPLLDAEKDHKTPESYMTWLKNESAVNPKHLVPDPSVSFLLNFGILMLTVLFIAIAKTPSSSGFFSIFTLLYALGALGQYFILYQLSSLIKWKLLGYRTDETIIKNWNNLVLLFLVPVIIIPLLIPWNYSIVKTTALTQFFNTQFAKIADNMTGGFINSTTAIINQNDSNMVIQGYIPQDVPIQNQQAFWNTVRIVLLAVVAFLVIYTILGIIGWALLNKYKYAKKPRMVQFLINRYYKLKNFFDILGGVFSPIGDFFARILGLKKPEEDEEAKQIEKHLYTYFESIKELPQEKQEEIRTIIREFVRLLQTSSRSITPYYFFQGPLEYTEKVIDMRPTLAIDLRKVANVFNESRYSLHILGEEVKSEFQRTVDSLIFTMEREKSQAKS